MEVPPELQEYLSQWVKAVRVAQPSNVLEFSRDWFARMAALEATDRDGRHSLSASKAEAMAHHMLHLGTLSREQLVQAVQLGRMHESVIDDMLRVCDCTVADGGDAAAPRFDAARLVVVVAAMCSENLHTAIRFSFKMLGRGAASDADTAVPKEVAARVLRQFMAMDSRLPHEYYERVVEHLLASPAANDLVTFKDVHAAMCAVAAAVPQQPRGDTPVSAQ